MSRRTELAPYLMLASAVGFWGGSYRFTLMAGRHTPGLMLAAVRPAVAAALLVVLLPLLRARLPRGRPLGWSALTGLLMVSIFFVGHAEGTVRAGPGNAAVLSNTAPLFVLVLGRIFLAERITVLRLVGLCTGFAGVVVMVSTQLGVHASGGSFALGCGLALTGSLAWAAGTLLVRRLALQQPDLDVVGLTTVQYVVGALVLLPIAFAVHGTGNTDWGVAELWEGIAWISIGSSVLGVLAFFGALKRISAVRVTATQFLVPVGALLVEAVLGNAPGGVELAGMALAVLGVALVTVAPALARALAPARP